MQDKHFNTKVREYLILRNRYKLNAGVPDKYKIKESYKEIEKLLLEQIGDIYEYEGFILKKGLNVLKDKVTPYIQVFTKKSYEKFKSFDLK